MSRQKAIVAKHGEYISVENQLLKASIVESTKATYSFAGRAYFVQGQVFKGRPAICVGDYFKRFADNNIYFINSLLPEPKAEDLFFMYAVMCNGKISIYRLPNAERDKYGSYDTKETLIHKDIGCYYDVSTRLDKATNDGLIDQSIYTIMLPHKYMLSKGDIVTMDINIKGETAKGKFRVESVGSQVMGADISQLLFIGKVKEDVEEKAKI